MWVRVGDDVGLDDEDVGLRVQDGEVLVGDGRVVRLVLGVVVRAALELVVVTGRGAGAWVVVLAGSSLVVSLASGVVSLASALTGGATDCATWVVGSEEPKAPDRPRKAPTASASPTTAPMTTDRFGRKVTTTSVTVGPPRRWPTPCGVVDRLGDDRP